MQRAMTSPLDPHHGLRAHDLAVAALINVVWGLNIIAVKMAVAATAPFTAGFLRQAVVLIVCLPYLRIVPGRMRALLLLGVISGAAFLIAVNFSLLVSDNLAALAIAGQLGVPFSLLLAVIFLRERIALPRLLGIAFTFAGVVLLVFDPGVAQEIPGLILTAIGALCWAAGSLIQRQLAGVPVLTIYAWIGLIGSAVLAPIMWMMEPDVVTRLPQLPLRDLGWILFSAIGSTVLGQGGVAWLLQRHPVTTVAPLTLASPVVAIAASTWFLGTILTPMMIVGAMIVMTGVAIITFRSARKSKIYAKEGQG
jgi:O-acetylserine/cysteine efflux transporter